MALSCLSVLASDVDRIRELNQQIASGSSSKSTRRDSASQGLIRERAALLNELMARNPAAARELLLSPPVLRDLRETGTDRSLLERPFAYRGPVEASILDLPREKRAVNTYTFESGGETITAHGAPGLSVRCGDEVRIEGFRLGSAMLVTGAAVEKQADPAVECRTDGTQRVAVILAQFSATASPSLSKARVGELIFGATGRSAVNFYKEASYGQLTVTGDVFGWYTLDRVYKCGEHTALRAAALKAADADIDFTQYSRVVVITEGLEDCEVMGRGSIGCQTFTSPGERFRASYASVHFDREEDLLTTFIHEFGHNLGVGHARTARYPGAVIGPEPELATYEEYGDLFSIMGSGEGHFGASQKSTLGWIRQPADYRTVQFAGTFDLVPMQSPVPGIRALRVKRNVGDDSYLWIEYRQPLGAFDSIAPADLKPMFEGAQIRLQSDSDQLSSDLLDFTPPTIDEARLLLLPGYFPDPVLRPGKVWQDPFSDLTLEVLSMSPEQLRIAVRYDAPCTSVSGLTSGSVISPEGRPTAISVTAPADCTWNASANRTWMDVPTGLNRKGNASLTLEAQRNTSSIPRRGSVTIERRTLAVTQAGPPAPPAVQVFGPQRGTFPKLSWIATDAVVSDPNGIDNLKEFYVLINTSQSEQNACMVKYSFTERTLALKAIETNVYSTDTIQNGDWRFVSNSRCGAGYPFVSPMSDTQMSIWMDFAFLQVVSGPQEIYTMAVDRDGGTTGWVRQGSFNFEAVCRVVPRPFRSEVPAAGGLYAFEVIPTSEPCPWQVSSTSPWIKVENPTGNEYDLVLYSVEENPGPGQRTASLTLGEQTLQVIQDGAGTIRLSDFAVSPAETMVSSGSGVVTIHVKSASGVAWQAGTTAPWLSVVNKSEDSVTLLHETNPASSERRATLTIAGHSVVIRQLAGDPSRPAIAANGVVNAASFLAGISSGGWFTIRGVNLANTTRIWGTSDFVGGRLPTVLDGVQVLVNGKPAYVYYISPTQINALAPEDTTIGAVPIEVVNNGRRSLFEATLRRLRSPGLFMMPAPVARLVAATFPDGSLVAPPDTFPGVVTQGARTGDAVSLYTTGLGATTPAYPEGRLLEAPLPIPDPAVTVGGRTAKVLYAGLVSPGLYQINIEVPELPAGEHEIVVTAQGTRTQQRALFLVR